MSKDLDCVVCGSCVADLLIRPIPLDKPIGPGRLFTAEPVEITTGGVTSNTGIALARLGMKAGVLSYVGGDDFGAMIRQRLETEGIDCGRLLKHPTAPTSTTAVLIDPSGERSFAHCVGAPKLIDKQLMLANMDLFARAKIMLIGYYSLMPNLDPDLPEVFAAIRAAGCMTGLETAGDGGTMQPLDRILPQTDLYVPSREEAVHQTGQTDPRRIIDAYRDCGAPGLLGVKLGASGAMLSPARGQYIEIPPVQPPGKVVDTTGAGDSFLAGLIAGLLRGFEPEKAGRIAAAAGACCVTGYGASAGLRDFAQTAALAGV
jgi:sugar/nucleoside kinase (ribokinase family)